MHKQAIVSPQAPTPSGTYSQAIQIGGTVYLAGQIPRTLDTLDISLQITEVFENLKHVAKAAGGDLNDIVKLTVYLADLSHFDSVNAVMERLFNQPYPARTTFQVAALPKGAPVEIDAIMVLPA
jgi:reactive intermediate/imine deaminase